jgi:tetratricopeptide (TPR) repeat protein
LLKKDKLREKFLFYIIPLYGKIINTSKLVFKPFMEKIAQKYYIEINFTIKKNVFEPKKLFFVYKLITTIEETGMIKKSVLLIVLFLLLFNVSACTKKAKTKKAGHFYAECLTKSMEGNNQEALVLCQKAIEINPKHYIHYNLTADVYEKMNYLDKALECYQKIIDLKNDPEATEPVTNRDLYGVYMEMGQIYQKKYDKAKALECFNNAKSADPTQAGVVDGYIRRLNR